MYRMAICDDEALFARQNKVLVCRIMEENQLREGIEFEIDVYSMPDALRRKLQTERDYYQLVLMDIGLENDNGLAVARELLQNQASCRLIYITAYRDYVFDSFDTRPLQYLIKPIEKDKLAAAVWYDYKNNYKPEQILLRVGDKTIPVRLKDILYVETTQHKSTIHRQSGQSIFWNGPLSSLQRELPSDIFCRCHNSYLTNLQYVSQIVRYEVTLNDGERLPVSKQNYNKVMDQYIQFLKT